MKLSGIHSSFTWKTNHIEAAGVLVYPDIEIRRVTSEEETDVRYRV
jgi:hypothetical protein